MATTINGHIRNIQRTFSNHLEDNVREHLTKVYACLTLSCAVASAGAYVHAYTTLLSASLLTHLIGLGCLLGVHFTQHEAKNINMRLGLFMGFSFSTGLGLGSLVEYATMLDPSIVVTALIGTIFIFASFSLSAIFAKRGYFLFLAAPLSTMITTLLGLSLANIFFRSQLIFKVNLYLGLLAMCGFVIFDTVLILEKRRRGDKDFIGHSLDLFIDFIGIFKRILIILTEEARKKNKDK